MAKKQTLKTPKPKQTTIRFSDADYELFKFASDLEGFEGNVLQWLLIVGRRRARLLKTGGAVRVTEVMVPPPEQTRVETK